jgi:hypothetical protein
VIGGFGVCALVGAATNAAATDTRSSRRVTKRFMEDYL